MNKALAALPMLGLLAGSVIACGSSSPAPITSKGTVVVDYTASGPLWGGTGDDLGSGSQVVILNPAGDVISSGNLNLANTTTMPGETAASGDFEDTLTWNVTVPGGLSRYGVRITTHGTLWYSASQIKNPSISLDETTDGS
jgi:hypothetical protein